MVRACGSYPQCPGFDSLRRHHLFLLLPRPRSHYLQYVLKCQMSDELMNELLDIARAHGMMKLGVADLAPFKAEAGSCAPEGLIDRYTRAISMAVAVPDDVVDKITDLPTNEYAHWYWKLNDMLNRAAFAVALWIEGKGYASKALPASYFADEARLMGNVSHKAVARAAGLGWQGKSLLLVTPERGPRVRLVTVLTDMPLAAGAPIENRCGDCTECRDACPVGAIKGVGTKDRYQSREDALLLDLCYERTKQNKERPEIGALVCGACIRACPWGQGPAN